MFLIPGYSISNPGMFVNSTKYRKLKRRFPSGTLVKVRTDNLHRIAYENSEEDLDIALVINYLDEKKLVMVMARDRRILLCADYFHRYAASIQRPYSCI